MKVVCDPNENTCTCDKYPDFQYLCQEWEGSADLTLALGSLEFVMDIPMGAQEVSVSLLAAVDMDLKMYQGHFADEDATPTTCLVGYGCAAQTAGDHVVDGQNVNFSGDGGANVEEKITIESVTSKMSIFVRSWDDGNGKVTWGWNEIDPCPTPDPEDCNTCSDFQGCQQTGKLKDLWRRLCIAAPGVHWFFHLTF